MIHLLPHTRRNRALTGLACAVLLNGIVMTGCQPNNYKNMPPPRVRAVQWPKKTPAASLSHQFTASAQSGPRGWVPPRHLEAARRWDGVVIHHSALDFGDADTYDRQHRSRGWDSLGYHFVINNGNSSNGHKDGEVEVGLRWKQQTKGAHCRIKSIQAFLYFSPPT